MWEGNAKGRECTIRGNRLMPYNTNQNCIYCIQDATQEYSHL